uniref:Uncharacterized protein n=1 Tax=Romanomermis culicivorax TaxID=13658 RepID=A0A915K3X6_ROMCU
MTGELVNPWINRDLWPPPRTVFENRTSKTWGRVDDAQADACKGVFAGQDLCAHRHLPSSNMLSIEADLVPVQNI